MTVSVRTGTLSVAGARLHYEVRGEGPPLLFIATGNGDAAPFGPAADLLADTRTVITYDRRGFSRSVLTSPVDDATRVRTDAADAVHLLRHLGCEPADVYGTCSGGITALAVLELHPSAVRTVVSHEPPLVSALPDAERWLAFYAELHQLYRTRGLDAAKEAFRDHVGIGGQTRPPDWAQPTPQELAELLDRLRRNTVFWFEHEMLPYPEYKPDMTILRSNSGRLVLAGSTDATDEFPYRPIAALAHRLQTDLVHFPGGHVGHVTHPVEFVAELRRQVS